MIPSPVCDCIACVYARFDAALDADDTATARRIVAELPPKVAAALAVLYADVLADENEPPAQGASQD